MTQPGPDATPWLSGEQLADWRAVMALVMTLPAALDAQLKRDSGMTLFEYHVLAALSESPHEEAPMSDLARLSQSSPSRLSHAVWAGQYLTPWVLRRLRHQSSGDDVLPKRPEPTRLRASEEPQRDGA